MQKATAARIAAVRAIVLLVVAMTAISSCSTLRKIFEGRFEEPRVSLESAELERLSFTQADLLFNVKVENPNKVGLKLAGFDYSLFIDGTRFLEGVQNRDLQIEPRGQSMVQLPLTVRFDDLFKTLGHLADRDRSSYRLEMGLRFDIPALGEMRIPVSKEGEVPVLKVPSLRLVALEVSRIDFTDADLVFTFALKNPNPLTFFLDGLTYQLEVGEQIWAAGEVEKRVEITGKGETVFKIPFRVFTFFIGQTGYRLLLEGKPFPYALRGTVALSSPIFQPGTLDLPFGTSGTISATR